MYFVLLDQSLEEPKADDVAAGVGGELWEVHGGGFYHVKKYKVAPPTLPDHLALVQVGGLHDVALGLRPDGRPLLLQRERLSDRPLIADLSSWEAVGSVSRCSSSPGSSTTCSAGRSRASSARGAACPADDARRLGLRSSCSGPRRVPPGRRDARHDHGGERLLQHHPGPPGADQREEGGPRARSDARHLARKQVWCTTTTSRCRCCSRCSPGTSRSSTDADSWLMLIVDDADRRLDPAVLQPAPPGPDAWAIPGRRRSRSPGSRS